MNLDAITVKIRPRNPWEAMDIGFLLARKWYLKLFLLWWLTSFPFLLVITVFSFILPGTTPKWALVLFWLFKPFFELPILSWISRALFDVKWTIRDTIRDVRKHTSFKRVISILFNRFSPFRSFLLPVIMLEGLEGKTRRDRLKLLKGGYEGAVFLTVAGLCIEVILTFSLMSILYWFIPEELRWVDFGAFIFEPDNWLIFLSYVVSCAMFSPLYICSGFMMYISRRVEFEAWDIEIGFKKIRQRIQSRNRSVTKALSVLLLISISLTPLSDRISAAPLDPETAHTTVTDVLDQNDFGKKVTKYHWVSIEKNKPEKESAWAGWWKQFFNTLGELLDELGPYIAKPGEVLLWCFFGILIAFLLLRYSHLRLWLFDRLISANQEYTPPEIMFGMDLRPESLPEDIGTACRELLEIGKKREAMSLLYRGTLSSLINYNGLQIRSSYTENECCDEVKKSRPASESVFFNKLTSLWIFIAYGHRTPDKKICHALISRWQSLFGVQS